MNIGAFIGFLLDARERRAYLARLQTPALGFREEKGAWLWRLHLKPLKEEIDTPTGPAVALSAMLGMPLSRLRTCLPDDILGWDLGASLGRQHVFSTKLMAAALDAHQQLVPPLFGGSGCCGTSGGVAAADDAAAVDAEAAASDASVMEDFIGTALVLAFLQCAALVPVAQLAERRSAAKRRFAGVTTVRFPSHLFLAVRVCADDDSLRRTARWVGLCKGADRLRDARQPRHRQRNEELAADSTPLCVNRAAPRACISHAASISSSADVRPPPPGRLIMSQTPEGFWDASSTTAFALEARSAAETESLPPQSLYQRVTTAASICATEDMTEALAYMGGAAMDDARLHADRKHGVTPAEGTEASDCPLSCPASAILESVPAALAAVRDAAPEVDPGRVWTTMLAICVLERMKHSFIWGDGCVHGSCACRHCVACMLMFIRASLSSSAQRLLPGEGAHHRGRCVARVSALHISACAASALLTRSSATSPVPTQRRGSGSRRRRRRTRRWRLRWQTARWASRRRA